MMSPETVELQKHLKKVEKERLTENLFIMLKRPGYMNKGEEMPPVYEIGDGVSRSRGFTPELAIERWNKEEFVV